MSYAAHIVDDIFGGSRRMALDLTVAKLKKKYPHTTIQSWKDAGVIPSRHHEWVLARGRELGKKIGPSDFFAQPRKSAAAEKRAAP